MPMPPALAGTRRRLIRLLTGAAVAATALGAAAGARADTTCPLSQLSPASQPACWQPFTAASPFNTPLSATAPPAAESSAVQQHMATYGWFLGDSSTGFSISATDGTRPVYFASPSDPIMTIDCTAEEGPGTCAGGNGIDVNGAQIHVPAGAEPDPNWDAHMVIVETDTGLEYDLWHASVSGSTITSGTGAVENVNASTGIGDGGDAANFALTAGLLRPSELASGHIDHALALDIPCTDAHGPTVGYSWPANGGWGEYCGQYWNESTTGAPPIGALFKLNLTPAQIAASGAPAWEQTIMTALAQYGGYAEDTNGSWHSESVELFLQSPASWTSFGQPNAWTGVMDGLGGQNGTLSSSVPIPMSAMEVVDPCVPEGTCPASSDPATGSATSTPVTTTSPTGSLPAPVLAPTPTVPVPVLTAPGPAVGAPSAPATILSAVTTVTAVPSPGPSASAPSLPPAAVAPSRAPAQPAAVSRRKPAARRAARRRPSTRRWALVASAARRPHQSSRRPVRRAAGRPVRRTARRGLRREPMATIRAIRTTHATRPRA